MSDDHLSPNLEGADAFAFEPQRIDKPWGYEVLWAQSPSYCGKILFIRAGEALSLQFHRVKDEAWFVQSGRAELEVGAVGQAVLQREVIKPGSAYHFTPGTVHRMTAIDDCDIFEVSTPELHDVVRLEDRYGRSS